MAEGAHWLPEGVADTFMHSCVRDGRAHGDLPNTQKASECLVRLPLWVGMTEAEVSQVIETVYASLR